MRAPSHAEVLVRYQDGHVELTVSDDGSGGGGGDSGGHGLVGMRERISVYGGELEAGHFQRGRLSAACETPGRMTGTYTFLLTDIEGSTRSASSSASATGTCSRSITGSSATSSRRRVGKASAPRETRSS